jgi:hypothetical protein
MSFVSGRVRSEGLFADLNEPKQVYGFAINANVLSSALYVL